MGRIKIYTILFVTAMVCFMGVSHEMAQRLTKEYTPLIDAVMVVKLETTRAHLWFEEVVSGDDAEELSEVWGHFDRADRYALAMTDGGNTEEWEYIPLADKHSLDEVRQIQSKLKALRQLAQTRWDQRDQSSGAGSPADQQFDKLFRNIVAQCDDVEEDLHILYRESLEVQRWVEYLLLVGIGLMAVALFLIVARFEKQSKRMVALADEESVELAREMAFLKQAIDEHAIVSGTDKAGRINTVNQQFCDISGFSKEELMGQNHRMLKSDEHPKSLYETMWKTIASGQIWHGEVKNFKKGGGFYWVKATIVPFLDLKGKPFKYISIRTDITKVKEQEQELEAALIEAKAATAAKSDFLANMSHEIRTPMNAILGMSYLALQTDLSLKQRGYVDKVHGSAKGLLGIINDILDFSKIEANKMEIEEVPFSLDEVVNNLLTVATLNAQQKGLDLEVHVEDGTPSHLMGDPLRLGQVLLNLVNNAIKFTEAGEVALFVKATKRTDTNLVLQFEVKDTGIGLSKEQQEKLFRSFSQADSSTTRKYGGTGLGLSIAKKLTELMGGEIWVKSEAGQGSQFFFTAQLNRNLAPLESVSFNRAELTDLNVLILDDSASARHILGELASSFGLSAKCASIGLQALKMIDKADAEGDPFDLFIVDWKMAGMNGPQTLERLQADIKHRHFPAVVMMSSYDLSDMKKA